MKTMLIFFAAMFVLLLSACEGPEGPTGPKGKDGKDGNANVHFNTFTVSSWNYSSTNVSWFINLSDPNITTDIVDYGAVLVYMKFGGGDWQLLPYSIFTVTSTASYTTRYTIVYDVGTATIYVTDSDLTQPSNPNTARGTHYFKVVTIATFGKYSSTNINWQNYNDVKMKLNLDD
jgi:hypothetical protein